MLDSAGRWMPDLHGKGIELYNCYHRYVLCHGPRKSAKSVSVAKKLVRHAWEHDRAMIAVLAKTKGNARSGFWTHDLINFAIPEWLENCAGFQVTKQESMTADSKTSYFRVRNFYGTESEFQLHSLDYDEDVERKFRATRFSAIYMSEADEFGKDFRDPKMRGHVFRTLAPQLRSLTIPNDHCQLILDTNPPEDGDENWMHELFFKPEQQKLDRNPNYWQRYKAFHFTWDDNPWLSQDEKSDLIELYSSDPNLKARFIDGKWIKDMRVGLFSDVLLPNIHIVGNCKGTRSEWEILTPGPQSFEMIVGWDPGDVHHCVAFATPRAHPMGNVYDFFDELAIIQDKVSLADLTYMVLEKMDYWENFVRREYGIQKVSWRHWSDSSVDKYRSASDADDALTIRMASAGKINLMSVHKSPGSVYQRIQLLRKMLHTNRVFFSASMEFTCEMLQRIKKGASANLPITRGSIYKQIFDPITYLLMSESPMDMEQRAFPKSSRVHEIVSVG